jgi:hypothetical protein
MTAPFQRYEPDKWNQWLGPRVVVPQDQLCKSPASIQQLKTLDVPRILNLMRQQVALFQLGKHCGVARPIPARRLVMIPRPRNAHNRFKPRQMPFSVL